MKVCIFGLWHLGCVTAACVSEKFPTVGLDPGAKNITDLSAGAPPVMEPGLSELIQSRLAAKTLVFTTNAAEAVNNADLVWVAFDTPVDENDRADVTYVEGQIASIFPYLRDGTGVLVSSQLPVGTVARTEAAFHKAFPTKDVAFACSPENLRLGKALDVFRNPGRIVVGTRTAEDRARFAPLLEPFCSNLIWMSTESAEMTKHALNAFLANSVAFINEIAKVCEAAGADAKEVEAGLKSDERIGQRAYLGAGGPFAGGTLARDIAFLNLKASEYGFPLPVLEAVRRSNDLHKDWSREKLQSLLGSVAGKRIAVLGLTYKPGTNTLRRSSSVELCRWLAEHGAKVVAFDPAISGNPEELAGQVTVVASAAEALENSEAVVIATEWPAFREISANEIFTKMKTPIVIDANRFLEKSLAPAPPMTYVAVGRGAR